jgi:hypothetical protein
LDCFAAGEEQAKDVGVEETVEMLCGELFDRSELIDSGVVDKDVEAAEGGVGLSEEPLHVGGIGDIPLDRDCFAALAGDAIDNAVSVVFAGDVIDDDGSSLLGKALCDRRSDSL